LKSTLLVTNYPFFLPVFIQKIKLHVSYTLAELVGQHLELFTEGEFVIECIIKIT
jgi:hypothetical protein